VKKSEPTKYKATFWDGEQYCTETICHPRSYGVCVQTWYLVLTGKWTGALVHIFDVKEKTII
jgi:hypothetical protein